MPNPIVNSATAKWQGDLPTGTGSVNLDTSGAGSFEASWKARSEESGGTTTPEELIAAAHATCFSMQFSHFLAENGTTATKLDTNAKVTFVAGEGITRIDLTVTGQVPGISAEAFNELAEKAKDNCPVSLALAAVKEITLEAKLA